MQRVRETNLHVFVLGTMYMMHNNAQKKSMFCAFRRLKNLMPRDHLGHSRVDRKMFNLILRILLVGMYTQCLRWKREGSGMV
jgi:hypothetical protein